jgi:nucleoside-diphosphate-sugar epimerase
MTQAKQRGIQQVELWGTGSATRDFLYVKDAAKGILQAVEHYDKKEPVNLANSKEISIKELANLIKNEVNYTGTIYWDTNKPDGQPRRLFDITRARKEFNFSPQTRFKDGLQDTIQWYNETYRGN